MFEHTASDDMIYVLAQILITSETGTTRNSHYCRSMSKQQHHALYRTTRHSGESATPSSGLRFLLRVHRRHTLWIALPRRCLSKLTIPPAPRSPGQSSAKRTRPVQKTLRQYSVVHKLECATVVHSMLFRCWALALIKRGSNTTLREERGSHKTVNKRLRFLLMHQ